MAFGSNWFGGRFQVVTGPVGSSIPLGDPAAGGRVDRVTGSAPGFTKIAAPGLVALIDSGEAFADGTQLATDAQGRAVQASTGGRIVARALEGSSGAGDSVWVVVVTQETA